MYPNYDPFKDPPVEINTYIKKQYNKYVVGITLGPSNTKLILSDVERKSFEEDTKMNEINNVCFHLCFTLFIN